MSSPRVALISTATLDQPGSMRAYADTLLDALHRFAPEVDASLIELNPMEASGAWRRRAQSLMLLVKAWQQRGAPPDLWHVLDGSRAYVALGLSKAPIVVTAHDIIPRLQSQGRFPGAPATGVASRWLWRRNGEAMRKAAALVCDSESTANDTRLEFGNDPSRSTVVALPLRPQLAALATRVSPGSREPGLVFHVGNNSFYKNRKQVLRIFAQLPAEVAVRLAMVGSPPTSELQTLADRLGISERVKWIENSDDATLVEYYQRASVLMFPSQYEGYGWPVLEAMAFGLPAVCSNRGSLPEVAGDAAAIVPIESDALFAAAVERVLREPQMADAMRNRGFARAAQFGTEQFALQMQAIYRKAAASRGSNR